MLQDNIYLMYIIFNHFILMLFFVNNPGLSENNVVWTEHATIYFLKQHIVEFGGLKSLYSAERRL